MMPFAMGAAFWAVRPPKWWKSPEVIPAEPKAETEFTAAPGAAPGARPRGSA